MYIFTTLEFPTHNIDFHLIKYGLMSRTNEDSSWINPQSLMN